MGDQGIGFTGLLGVVMSATWAWRVMRGVRTGRIRYDGPYGFSYIIFSRNDNPWKFWSTVAWYSGLSALGFVVGVMGLYMAHH